MRIKQIMAGALRTYRQEGARQFVQRSVLWLRGTRRYHPVIRGSHPSLPPANLTLLAQARQPLVPAVSIIIPVHNALDYATACVTSLYQSQCDTPFEIILVDNGSAANVTAWMRQLTATHANLTAVRLATNIGYGSAINVGARYARGEFLLLANSDTLFTDHAVDFLVAAMQPNIGVCSPVTNYVGHGPQIDPHAVNLPPAAAPTYARSLAASSEIVLVDEHLIFFCVMVRRAIFQLLNGFDEAFRIGNYEDNNFCARVRQLGLNLALVRHSFVYHHGSKTFQHNDLNHDAWMAHNATLHYDRLAALSTDTSLLTLRPRREPRKPHVSVIVRTCNRPDKLRHALTSLAMQHFEDFEVIVVNDGGADVAPLLHEFEPYFAIQYIHHHEPRRRSMASNAALAAMQGDFFIHLDDDDIVYPYHLASLYHLAQANPAERVFYSEHHHVLMQEQAGRLLPLQHRHLPPWSFSADDLLYANFVAIHTSFFHREIYDRVGTYNPDYDVFEDWDYLIRASRSYPFIALNRITCEYRLYPSFSNTMLSRVDTAFAALQRIYACYPTTDPHILAQREQNINRYHHHLALIASVEAEVASGQKTQLQASAAILYELTGFQLDKV